MRLTVLALVCALVLPCPLSAAELLRAGQSFPDWQMSDHTGAKLSAADLKGKTYLLWYYPKAMTPGCTAEGISLRDNYEKFRTRGVEILGVSFDGPGENAAFVREQSFPFRLLSDSDRRLAVAVGAADSPGQFLARRISYVVGPDGKVLLAYGSVEPNRHAEQVLTDLASEKK